MAANTTEMVRVRPITADEYQRMGETGILGPHERVELLNGRIIEMPPIGHRHGYGVTVLNALLQRMLGDRAVLVVEGVIRLDPLSEPQPDVVVVRGPIEQYAVRHPTPEDALLVIEVADSSFRFDRGEKFRAYARQGIPEYWIVDVRHDRFLAFSEPDGERYRTEVVVERGGSIALGAFPNVAIAVDKILPPRA